MGITWTHDQQRVIDLRDRNILVSAAAGSGKTAVLVERIVKKITDPVKPVPIDRLLVVTFTRAAAGEMKERIGKALEEMLEADPENAYLQQQSILLHNARISTIHGFCTYIIKNYFHTIDLDPVFRIGEEGEIKLLKADVLAEVLEEEYQKGEEAFLDFADAFAPGKSDEQMENLILKIYDFAISDPDPEECLNRSLTSYQAKTKEELEGLSWMQDLIRHAKGEVEEAAFLAEQNLMEAYEEDGPTVYIPQLEEDAAWLQELSALSGYEELYDCLHTHVSTALSRKACKGCLPKKREEVKKARGNVQEMIKNLKERYFVSSPEQLLEELSLCEKHVRVLLHLTRQFMQAFSHKKQSISLMDFSDLEHYALKILLKKGQTGLEKSEIANEISGQFEEVMCDEYQDSNLIQEYILDAVSGEGAMRHNRFMVGDMKQAIYGFRKARPDLFLDKYISYKKESDACERIDLSSNYRSRSEVIEPVNFLFGKMMTGAIGGPVYSEDAALHRAAPYEPAAKDLTAELYLMDKKSDDFEDDRRKEALIEAEAHVVAKRIRELMAEGEVYDLKQKAYRPVKYSDIVILFRSMNGWSQTFSKVLRQERIPVFAESRSGYFSTQEIMTVVNYLRVLDNPRQDIPLAAVLRSAIVGLSDQELALMKAERPDLSLYDAALTYSVVGEDETQVKLVHFFRQLEDMAEAKKELSIHQLLRLVLDETGFGVYAAALPGGEQRAANLEMLVQRASEYEKTSYHGLFHFIRYIDKLKKYDVDYGEVNIAGEYADTVRIMSIHKSKGLEFPVVFMSGMGHQFNQMDINNSVLTHSSMGISLDYINTKTRKKTPSTLKGMMRLRIHQDDLAEEMRILYVGMTRAKEKLIMTGMMANMTKKIEDCKYHALSSSSTLSYHKQISGSSFLDWILLCLSSSTCMEFLYHSTLGKEDSPELFEDAHLRIVTPSVPDLVEEEEQHMFRKGTVLAALQAMEDDFVENAAGARAFLQKRDSFIYPYADRNDLPQVVSVSALKKQHIEEQQIIPELCKDTEEKDGDKVVLTLPSFMKEDEEKKVEGAQRGSIFHRAFECIDYQALHDGIDMKEQIRRMVESGKLKAEEAGILTVKPLEQFVESPLGSRIGAAHAEGNLYRERPFVLGLPASDIQEGWDSEELVMVQGIIDLYFEEDGELVLVDYKTDRVYDKTGEDLVKTYRTQLSYYKRALEQISGKRVKEVYIYSVPLGKALLVS